MTEKKGMVLSPSKVGTVLQVETPDRSRKVVPAVYTAGRGREYTRLCTVVLRSMYNVNL